MNHIKCVITVAVLLLTDFCPAAIITKNLRCEYLAAPLGLDVAKPRVSWILDSSQRGEMQTAYQVIVASSPELLSQEKGDLWDSGKVLSDESAQIEYLGSPLTSRQNCYWKVRAWDRNGQPGEWSNVAHWQMGLLESSDWNAKWITSDASASSAAGTLVIRRATYEAVQSTSGVDVTAALSRQVKYNHLIV